MRKINALNAKTEAYREEMERDEKVILLGEDVAIAGGLMGQTKGFAEQFGFDRVVQTTLNEAGHGMFGVGLAFSGYKPIIEFGMLEFASYAFAAMVCEAAKQRYMTYGALSCPALFVMPHGGGYMLGGNHSSYGEGWFSNCPGIKVYAPLYPADIKGLLKYAIREEDPVIYLESKAIALEGEVPDLGVDYLVEPGKANTLVTGTDLTIVGWQYGILKAMESYPELKSLGINPEIIDIRTIVPLDVETITKSVAKTGKLVVISEARKRGGFGNDIIAAVIEHSYGNLRGKTPVWYVGGKDYPLPFGHGEKYIMPNKEDLVEAVKRVMQ
jgi:pyruvate dehydrogenase E1 component beta subunit